MRNLGTEDRPEKGIRMVMWEEENLQTVVSGGKGRGDLKKEE